MEMFCNQCEQAYKGRGCDKLGVCGKDPEVAALQDLLIYALKGLAYVIEKALAKSIKDEAADRQLIEGLFTTVTNVNFNPVSIQQSILKTVKMRDTLKNRLGFTKIETDLLPSAVTWTPSSVIEGLVRQGAEVGLLHDKDTDANRKSLKSLYLYGLKGMAAYADHAWILGKKSDAVTRYFSKGLAALLNPSLGVEDWLSLVMEFGGVNLECMKILDEAHVEHFGHPVPTKVALGVRKGPAILVSGHDLLDLEELLKQTEGKGINIYTHGEMLPAHGYPKLNQYKHLAGNYGGAWQDQAKEFDVFPGAILMTTNCIQEPRDTYKERIFTTGLVDWPGVTHIDGQFGKKDFSRVIAAAIKAGGFKEDKAEGEILVGFARHTVLSVADKVVGAVKAGALKHFFLIGGCDGAKPGRNYFTEFAEKVPQDCAILTLACGKFRFNKKQFGDIGGIPRLLDVGQCNDAYSAIEIALALAEAFKCGVNDLPLSLVLSWYEQKAVCILITLLSLGIKNIRLGPSLPAFITPDILKVLVDEFQVKPTGNADADLAACLAKS